MIEFEACHGKPLSPVKQRAGSLPVPPHVVCLCCGAPSSYLYFNDGKKRSQILCKVCSHLFQLQQRFKNNRKSKLFCPYCGLALFRWKSLKELTIHKCSNDNCPHRIQALAKLNPAERELMKRKSSQFKINYQYREYHFKPEEMEHSSPQRPPVELAKIHNSENVLGLILTFYVSFAVPARKTAAILREVFRIKVSHQTVLNYAAGAAWYCHRFNLKHKGQVDGIAAGDETYIKVLGRHHYVFFFISAKNLKITAYHLADNRGTLPAVIAMNEASGPLLSIRSLPSSPTVTLPIPLASITSMPRPMTQQRSNTRRSSGFKTSTMSPRNTELSSSSLNDSTEPTSIT